MVSICKMADMRLLPIISNLDLVIPRITARSARPVRHTRVHHSTDVDAQVFTQRLAQYHINHPARCHGTCPNYVRALDHHLEYKDFY
jgi:hypothetical protein